MHLSTIVITTLAAMAGPISALPTTGAPHRMPNSTAVKNTTSSSPPETRLRLPFIPGMGPGPRITGERHSPVQSAGFGPANCPMLCALHAEACAAALPYNLGYCWRVVHYECSERCYPEYYIR